MDGFFNMLSTMSTTFEWWQVLIFMTVPIASYIIYKIILKQSNIKEHKENLEICERKHTTSIEVIDNLKTNIYKLRELEKEHSKNVDDLKTFYTVKIETNTEDLIIKIGDILDLWFKNNILNSEDFILSTRCKDCKRRSFYSAKDNLRMTLKDTIRATFVSTEISRTGNMTEKEIGLFIENQQIKVKKKIMETLDLYYIIQEDINKYTYETNSSLDKTIHEVNDVVDSIFRYMLSVEQALQLKIIETTEIHNSKVNILMGNVE